MVMRHLIIENVGPIKKADLELKKFNFFIGPQSSGKSTIAKIFSTCSWIEKEVATTMNELAVPSGLEFKRLVEEFHKMSGYFSDGSIVEYDSESVGISFSKDDFKIVLKPGINYFRQKICYIPSERNIVSLQDLRSYEFGNTNQRSFLFDWLTAREFYSRSNKLEILNLGVKYFYDSEQELFQDRIEHVNGKSYQISLQCASSGLQSVIPLILMFQYYSAPYYSYYENKTSFDENDKDRLLRIRLIDKLVLSPLFPGFSEKDRSRLLGIVNARMADYDPQCVALLQQFQKAIKQLRTPVSTNFIVEEPEQNLYPYTQLQLIDCMFRLCGEGKNHSFTITTHSPYIMNILNVLLMRYYSHSGDGGINPDDLSVFSIQDGYPINQLLKNSITGNLSVSIDNLSEAMQDLYDEYRELKRS